MKFIIIYKYIYINKVPTLFEPIKATFISTKLANSSEFPIVPIEFFLDD